MLGLSQSSVDCCMPKCELHPGHINSFLSNIDELYPQDECLRLLAHPLKHPSSNIGSDLKKDITFRRQINNNLKISISSTVGNPCSSIPFHRLQPPRQWLTNVHLPHSNKRVVIAVGPEGGWSDEEISLFQECGFIQVHILGERVLRTDIAVPALLALAYEWYDKVDLTLNA